MPKNQTIIDESKVQSHSPQTCRLSKIQKVCILNGIIIILILPIAGVLWNKWSLKMLNIELVTNPKNKSSLSPANDTISMFTSEPSNKIVSVVTWNIIDETMRLSVKSERKNLRNKYSTIDIT